MVTIDLNMNNLNGDLTTEPINLFDVVDDDRRGEIQIQKRKMVL